MRKKILILTMFLSSGGLCLAACPSADRTGDCFVDFNDFALLAADWPATDYNDLALLAAQWLTPDPRVPDDMAYIPAGAFQMGDSFGEGDTYERPVHAVYVDPFYMGLCEITNRLYCDYLAAEFALGNIRVVNGIVYGADDNDRDYPYCDTSSYHPFSQIAFSGDAFSVRTKAGRDMSNDPMVFVSWYGAVTYCNWRSTQEGYEQCYALTTWDCDFSRHGYRLPTEAEWECAARAGFSGLRFPWGDTISHTQANYFSSPSYAYDVSPTRGRHPAYNSGPNPYTAPVAEFPPNAYGLYDMTGNVWEWCNDWYNSISNYYSVSPYDNPTGPTWGSSRCLRGGSWQDTAPRCRVATRFWGGPRSREEYAGFRLVLDLE